MTKKIFKKKVDNMLDHADVGTYILHMDRCNQRCLFCMEQDPIDKKPAVTEEKIFEEIAIAKMQGYKKVDFYGGEPTVFSFLKKGVLFVESLDMQPLIPTNGMNFSSQNFTKNFFNGVDSVKLGMRISLHSHNAEIHDRITQVKGSHKKTVRGIKNILAYKKRFSVNIVITSLNYKELVDIVRFACGLGVLGIKFSGLVMQGGIKKQKWLVVKPDKYKKHLKDAIIEAKNLGFMLIEVEKLPISMVKSQEFKKIKGVNFTHPIK